MMLSLGMTIAFAISAESAVASAIMKSKVAETSGAIESSVNLVCDCSVRPNRAAISET